MNPRFTKIAEGLAGAEGPVFNTQGSFFMVVPYEGLIVQVTEDGQVHEFANTGGIPAGLQCDKEDNLWVADMALGILRVSPEGEVEHVVSTYEGTPMRGCNDCYFDSKGNLYVTAPAGSDAETPVGELYCLTASREVFRLDGGFRFCNGVVVSADDRQLIVAETRTKSLWIYDIEAPGVATHKRLWAKVPGEHVGGPDGMDFDEVGNLLVTNHGGGAIEVFGPDGRWLESIETPFDKPSNVHFGGDDDRWVYVTEHTNDALWKFHWRHKGQAQYCVR